MKNVDLIIIGGGMVGLALCAALDNQDLSLVLIEAKPPSLDLSQTSARVSALNLASENWLKTLGVWENLPPARLSAYDTMSVRETDSFAHIDFNTQGLGIDHLGHIVENALIRGALWQKVAQQKNVEILTALPQQLSVNDSAAFLRLDNNEMISAKLVVGADGAQSWLRQQANIPLSFRDYDHHALVCNIQTAEAHGCCARQWFSPDSILAFLPLADPKHCSIVWSLPPERAQQLRDCDEKEFNRQLAVASDNRLGLCRVTGERQTFPLTARYARNFAQPRIALMGDAAHTIHPLAGLGVNLGFQDARALAQCIADNLNAGRDIGEYRYLREYERRRKVEAVKMLAAMQGIKSLFSGSHPLKKFVRGIGLSLTQRAEIVKEQLIRQALYLD